jgi:hypothetical protein
MDMDKATIEKSTIQYLKSSEASCPRCSHSLKELSRPRCPECGLKIRITLDHFGPLVWFVGLCSLLVCAGISVDQIGLFSVPVFIFGNNPLPLPLILPEVVVFVVLVFAIMFWWKKRRKSLEWSNATKIFVFIFFPLLPVLYFAGLLSIFILRR